VLYSSTLELAAFIYMVSGICLVNMIGMSFVCFQSDSEADLTHRNIRHNHLHQIHSLSSALTNSMHTLSTNENNNSISSINQPSYQSARCTTWQAKSGSLSNLNEKTVPSYQVIISYILYYKVNLNCHLELPVTCCKRPV